jgi:threonine/homoserine/homoserine lactone efflux protein
MISTLLIIASITFIAMMSPGPDMLLVVKYGCARDRWPVIACITGICCGVAVHVAFSILGIAAVIAASSTLFSMMKLAGACYLIYIGFKVLFSNSGLIIEEVATPKKHTFSSAFFDGLLCNVLNPKVTMFMLAMFTQVIEPSTPNFERVLYGLFIAFEAFVVWNLFVVIIRTQMVLKWMQATQVVINRVVGCSLVGFGTALVLDESR